MKIEGLDKLDDLIVAKLSAEAIARGVEKACAAVEADAKRNCPVNSGYLRRSIETDVEIKGDEVIGTIGTPVEYAPYLEYGTGLFAENGMGRSSVWHYQDDEGNWHSTHGQRPQPFLRPALYANRKDILRIIAEELNND